LGIFNIFRKPSKKEIRRERMEKIRERGKETERWSEQDNAFSPYRKTHVGADYVKTVHDSAGRERKEPHEVKRNNSPLSKKQKKTRGLKVDRYFDTQYGVERRTYNRAGEELKKDPLTNKWEKVRKRDSSRWSSLLGSNTPSRPKKSSSFNDNIWGSSPSSKKKNSRSIYENLLGSSPTRKSKKRKKEKSEPLGDFFGSSSSGKRSKSRSVHDTIWGSSGSSRPSRRGPKSSDFW